MFDSLLGNLEEQQAELRKKLLAIVITDGVDGIKITGNATKEVTNIEIEANVFTQEKEMLEDLLIVAVNKFFAKAVEKEGEETQSLMKDLLPPGFDDIFK